MFQILLPADTDRGTFIAEMKLRGTVTIERVKSPEGAMTHTSCPLPSS